MASGLAVGFFWGFCRCFFMAIGRRAGVGGAKLAFSTATARVVRVAGSDHQAHQLLNAQRKNAEHEVAEHLGVTPNPHEAAAIVVLGRAIDPLGAAALAIADILGEVVARSAPGASLGLGRGFAATARIALDDRHMAERAALGPDLRPRSSAQISSAS